MFLGFGMENIGLGIGFGFGFCFSFSQETVSQCGSLFMYCTVFSLEITRFKKVNVKQENWLAAFMGFVC